MFPNAHYRPSKPAKNANGLTIEGSVQRDFLTPPGAVARQAPSVNPASVPKTSIDENRDPSRAENDVRTPAVVRERPDVKGVSKSSPVQQPPDCNFAGCVISGLTLHPKSNCWPRSRRSRWKRLGARGSYQSNNGVVRCLTEETSLEPNPFIRRKASSPIVPASTLRAALRLGPLRLCSRFV